MDSIRVCWFGTLGCGKTMGAVKEAYRYALEFPDNSIFSNVALNRKYFPNFKEYKSVEQIFDWNKPCCWLDDEGWFDADSHDFKSPEAKAKSILLLRSRKLGWRYLTTQQWFTQLMLRMRFVVDVWIMPQYHSLQGVLQEDIYDLHANFLGQRFYDATKLYDLYDTNSDILNLDVDFQKKRFEKRRGLF